jgi:hypothetical protein
MHILLLMDDAHPSELAGAALSSAPRSETQNARRVGTG